MTVDCLVIWNSLVEVGCAECLLNIAVRLRMCVCVLQIRCTCIGSIFKKKRSCSMCYVLLVGYASSDASYVLGVAEFIDYN